MYSKDFPDLDITSLDAVYSIVTKMYGLTIRDWNKLKTRSLINARLKRALDEFLAIQNYLNE